MSAYPETGVTNFVDLSNQGANPAVDPTPQAFWLPSDGSDFTNAFTRAVAALAGRSLYVPYRAGGYLITSKIDIANSIRIYGPGNIVNGIPLTSSAANNRVFNITASDVQISDLTFTDYFSSQTSSNNRYCIFAGGGIGALLKNILIRNVSFQDLNNFGGSVPAITNFNYGIYLSYCERSQVLNNRSSNIYGYTIALTSCQRVLVQGNQCKDLWMPGILCEQDCRWIDICDNHLLNVTAQTYWGGLIDIMSQDSGSFPINKDINVSRNVVDGAALYGAAIRCGNVQRTVIKDNTILNFTNNSDITSGISVSPRNSFPGSDMSARGIRDVEISGNVILCPATTRNVGIYVQNLKLASNTLPDLENLRIFGNFILKDGGDFENGIICNPHTAKMREVWIEENVIEAKPSASTLSAGAISIVSDAGGQYSRVRIRGNKCKFSGGTPPVSTSYGIFISAPIADVDGGGAGIIDGFFQGVYIEPAYTVTLARYFDDNTFLNMVSSNIAGTGVYICSRRPITGTSQLVAGTKTVASNAIEAIGKYIASSGNLIVITPKTTGLGSGIISVGTITAGTSFVVNSSNAADTTIFDWMLIPPLV